MIHYILDKIASVQFWWVSKTLKEDRDYKFCLDDNYGDRFIVEILTGKYKGVRVEYSKLKVGELPGGGASLDFDTLVVMNPSNVNVTTKKFARKTSDIIRLILINSMKVSNESREPDSVELDEERTIREEDPPVRKARVSNRKPRKKAVPRNQ